VSAIAVDIADAIVALLAGHTFSEDFTPVRKILPKYEHHELSTLRVTVSPGKTSASPSTDSRGGIGQLVETVIGVEKLIDMTTSESEAEAMLALADDIRLYLVRRQLPIAGTVTYQDIEQTQAMSPDDLNEKHILSAFITVKHLAMVAVPTA
jgi:hypothetical protein